MDIVLNHVNNYCGMCTVVFSPISNVKHDSLIVVIVLSNLIFMRHDSKMCVHDACTCSESLGGCF